MMRRLKIYLLRHAQVLVYSAGQLARAPLTSATTIVVIGITLALPTALYLAIDNLQRVSRGWDTGGQISLFLKQDVSDGAAQKLAERLRRMPGIARTEYISRVAALTEFRRLSGFGEVLDALERNPLPAVIVVHPARSHSRPETLQALLADLRRREEVDIAQLDLEWVRRLHALLGVAERAVFILAGLLGLAVLLTIGNTIRLAVSHRHDEIEVMKLVGATNTFIHRPFLYAGLIQGLLGAVISWGIVELTVLLVSVPARELAALYGSTFRAEGLGLKTGLVLLTLGAILGWVGSRIAVGRHLAAIQPK